MKITRQRLAEIAREELQSILKECGECGDMQHNPDVEDYEADMVKSHLMSMSKQVQELDHIIQSNEDVEEWVQEKIAVAASMIDSVYHYLSYEESAEGHHDIHDENDEYYVEFADE
jgi:hypothetical protein